VDVHLPDGLKEPRIRQRTCVDGLEPAHGHDVGHGRLGRPSPAATNTWTGARPSRASAGSSCAKIVLKAFTTSARGASFWISSAAEVVCPISRIHLTEKCSSS
jgi:hypothetical protein